MNVVFDGNLGWLYVFFIRRNRVFIIDLVSRLNPFCIHRQPEPGTIGYVFRAAPDSCVHFQKPKC